MSLLYNPVDWKVEVNVWVKLTESDTDPWIEDDFKRRELGCLDSAPYGSTDPVIRARMKLERTNISDLWSGRYALIRQHDTVYLALSLNADALGVADHLAEILAVRLLGEVAAPNLDHAFVVYDGYGYDEDGFLLEPMPPEDAEAPSKLAVYDMAIPSLCEPEQKYEGPRIELNDLYCRAYAGNQHNWFLWMADDCGNTKDEVVAFLEPLARKTEEHIEEFNARRLREGKTPRPREKFNLMASRALEYAKKAYGCDWHNGNRYFRWLRCRTENHAESLADDIKDSVDDPNVSVDEVLAYAHQNNQLLNAPPLPDEDVEKIVEEAFIDRSPVIVNGRGDGEILNGTLRRLRYKNDPPRIFVREGMLVRLVFDENGKPKLVNVNKPMMTAIMTRNVKFCKKLKSGLVETHTPTRIAEIIVNDDIAELGFPALVGLTRIPMLRADGTLLVTPGYDAQSGMYFAPPSNFALPGIVKHPTRTDAVNAAKFLRDEIFCDFKFANGKVGLANSIAAMLTPIVRPTFAGPTPLFLTDAPDTGSGKSLLAMVIGMPALGDVPGAQEWPEKGEEQRKVITSQLVSGSTVNFFDNVKGKLHSQALESVLTSDIWRDRLLGGNTIIEVPNRSLWIASGNNLQVGYDMLRRCVPIRIDPKVPNPHMRDPKQFRHEDLLGWMKENHGEIVAALITMARAWWEAGCPEAPNLPAMGSYPNWCKTVGGILHVAGVADFLGGQKEFCANADPERAMWEAVLSHLHDQFAGKTFKAREVIAKLNGFDLELPEVLADLTGGFENSKGQPAALGKTLRAIKDRYYGPYKVEVAKSDTRHGHQWRIVCQS
ncbi:hypothetical protein Pan258_12590 [Symmachiella dynata]|uniref:hypothetical protein n=1 Tax=Symmachiella dynata TaxID=2527995 RepID=UPI001189702F|nr:hypothetical protein [Symmachiella dynata]QDT47228.1 hypothetical protein Pan258_12590 [Symmachiella dynata]